MLLLPLLLRLFDYSIMHAMQRCNRLRSLISFSFFFFFLRFCCWKLKCESQVLSHMHYVDYITAAVGGVRGGGGRCLYMQLPPTVAVSQSQFSWSNMLGARPKYRHKTIARNRTRLTPSLSPPRCAGILLIQVDRQLVKWSC